jgi:hypothetical protein
MFENTKTPTFLWLAAAEWEAFSLGIDGALDGDVSWESSLEKMRKECDETRRSCLTEIHYFRAGFSAVRYAQNHWAALTIAIGTIIAGIAYLKTTGRII